MILPLFLPNFSGSEIFIIAVVVLVLFGANKIPDFMKGLGRGVRGFKEGLNDVKREIDSEVESDKKGETKSSTEPADKSE